MVPVIVDEEDLDGHLRPDDGLQLLQVHHDASVAGQQDDILQIALPVRIRHAGADGRRQVIAHGGNGGVRDEALPFLNNIGMAAHHAGRAVAHHCDLILAHSGGNFPDKGIHICGPVVRHLHHPRKKDRIFLHPHPAGIRPAQVPQALSSAEDRRLLLREHLVHHCQKILRVRVHRHGDMERRLLQLLRVDIVHDGIRFPGPALPVEAHLPDA